MQCNGREKKWKAGSAWGIFRSKQSTSQQAARKESQIESGLDQLPEEISQSHICGNENYLQKECPRGNKQANASEALSGHQKVGSLFLRAKTKDKKEPIG